MATSQPVTMATSLPATMTTIARIPVTITARAGLSPVTMTTAANSTINSNRGIVKLPGQLNTVTSDVTKVTSVDKVTSTSKVTDTGKSTNDVTKRKKRKSSHPRRTSQSVLDMERAPPPPDRCYGNTNTATMRSTNIFSSKDFILHHMMPHLITNTNDDTPEVNFSYRQPAHPVCHLSTCEDDISYDSAEEMTSTPFL